MNTPGLPKKPNINFAAIKAQVSSAKAGSAKAAATSNLSNATRTSVFTRALGSNVGVHSNGWRGAARGLNPYDTVSANVNRFAAMRQSANIYTGGGMTHMHGGFGAVTGSGGDDMAKLMQYMAMAEMGVALGKGIADVVNAFKADKAAKTDGPDANPGTLNNSNINSKNTPSMQTAQTLNGTGASGAIQDMASADDSATLRGAIESAQGKAAELSTDISALQGEIKGLESKAQEAEKAVQNLNTQIEAKENEVKTAEQNVKNKENAVKSFEQKLDTAKLGLENMNKEYSAAVNNYASAQSATRAAEAALAATPKQIPGPDGTPVDNPAYANAKKAVDEAKAKEAEAKEAKETAYKNVQDAKGEVKSAEENVLKAQKDVDDAKGKEAEAKEALETKKDELEKLEQQKQTKQDIIDEYNDQNKKLEKQQGELEKLNKEITSQNERLTKLEQKEQKELKSLNDKIDKKFDKVAGRGVDESDGLSFKEKMNVKLNNMTNNRISDLIEDRDALEATINKNNELKADDDKYKTGDMVGIRNNDYVKQANGNFKMVTKVDPETGKPNGFSTREYTAEELGLT